MFFKCNVFLLLLLLNDLQNGDECKIINTGSVNTHKSLDVIEIYYLLNTYVFQWVHFRTTEKVTKHVVR